MVESSVLDRLLPGVTRAISDGEGDRLSDEQLPLRKLLRKGLGMLSGESGILIGQAHDGIFISTCRGFPLGEKSGDGKDTGGGIDDLRGGMGNSSRVGEESDPVILVGVTGAAPVGPNGCAQRGITMGTCLGRGRAVFLGTSGCEAARTRSLGRRLSSSVSEASSRVAMS